MLYKKCFICGGLMQWNCRGDMAGFECSKCPHDEFSARSSWYDFLCQELEKTQKERDFFLNVLATEDWRLMERRNEAGWLDVARAAIAKATE